MRRNDSDISVEDCDLGDTDENIVHAQPARHMNQQQSSYNNNHPASNMLPMMPPQVKPTGQKSNLRGTPMLETHTHTQNVNAHQQ